MKKVLTVALALVMALALTACGKSEAAQGVDDQIAAIGEVTLDSESAIAAAESALAALEDKDAEQVESADALAQARLRYDALLVEDAIAAIGTVTVDSGDAIAAARSAFDGASAAVQAAVTNAADLDAAETALSDLRVQEVVSLIDAIGEVTLDDAEAIESAQETLDKLSDADAAKVSNVSVLEAAAAQLETVKQAEAQKLLAGMRKEEDKIRGMSFYYPSAWKFYSDGSWAADVRCFILPYMGRDANSSWLRLVYNYTGDDWVFFKQVTVAADDERFYKTFNYFDIVHDNGGGDVWEYIDTDVYDSDIEMLWAIANSTETLVRFEGDDYSFDYTVTEKDKASIREILTAYEALK